MSQNNPNILYVGLMMSESAKNYWSSVANAPSRGLLFDSHLESCSVVDLRTWIDLEMSSVASRLDMSFTSLGSFYLHALLSKYERSQERLTANVKSIQIWSLFPKVRASFGLAVERLKSNEAASIAECLAHPIKPVRLHRLFYAMSILSLLAPLLCFVNPFFLLVIFAIWVINCGITWHYGFAVRAQCSGLVGIAILLQSGPKVLEALQNTSFPEVEQLSILNKECRPLRRKISYMLLPGYTDRKSTRL